jgi:hypothetical protein
MRNSLSALYYVDGAVEGGTKLVTAAVHYKTGASFTSKDYSVGRLVCCLLCTAVLYRPLIKSLSM